MPHQRRVEWVSKAVALVLSVAVLIPPAVFSFLSLKTSGLPAIAHSVTAKVVGYVALLLYLVAWDRGARTDLRWIQSILTSDPRPWEAIGRAIVSATFLVASFLLMCWCMDQQRWRWLFSSLTVFWLTNIATWRFVAVPYVSRLTAATESLDVRQALLRDHLVGSWHVGRFVTGTVVALLSTALAWSSLPVIVVGRLGWPGPSHEIAMALLFAAFVVLVEGWMWVLRWRLMGGLDVLADLEERGFRFSRGERATASSP